MFELCLRVVSVCAVVVVFFWNNGVLIQCICTCISYMANCSIPCRRKLGTAPILQIDATKPFAIPNSVVSYRTFPSVLTMSHFNSLRLKPTQNQTEH